MPDEDLRDLERQVATGGTDAARRLLHGRHRAGLCSFHAQPTATCAPCREAREIDWGSLFRDTWETRCEGATPEELVRLDEDLRRPLSGEEVKRLESNLARANLEGSVEPSKWILPDMPMPPSFRSLLSWSNGGNFARGAREFGFFGTSAVRDYLLDYGIPQWMPGSVPFAFDGGGTFYLFDMRRMPVGGEYPVLFCHAGCLGYGEEECWRVADSLVAACRGTTDPHDDRRGQQPTYPKRVDVWLVAEPTGGVKGLVALKESLALASSIRALKKAFDDMPARILYDVPFLPTAVRCARHNKLNDCLEVRTVDGAESIDVSALGG